MSRKISSKRAVVVMGSLSALTFISTSHGAVISFTDTLPTQSGDFSQNFTLSQFDPSLGTLTGATITYDAITTPEVGILDLSGAGGSYTNAQTKVTANFTGPDGNDAAVSATAGPFSGTVAPSTPLSTTYTSGTATPSTTTDTVTAGDLGDFVGLGTESFNFASGDDTSSGSVGDLYVGGDGSFDADATIAYTYTAVPEPASLSVLALGVPMLLRRRRTIAK